MKVTDEMFGSIIGTEVRWWSERYADNYPRIAARASNVRYPLENPWKIDVGHTIISSGSGSYKDPVDFSQGTVVGATEEYAVVSSSHRLIPIKWCYLWIE